MTRLELHIQQWSSCTKCDLYKQRKQVVHVRGMMPCDVAFIGEAPGLNENSYGQPFVGPAGNVLDQLLAATERIVGQFRWGLMNLLGCVPLDDNYTKVTNPPVYAVQACYPRLADLVKIADPKLIICLGADPAKWIMATTSIKAKRGKLLEWCDVPKIHVEHPASIVRMPMGNRVLALKHARSQLVTAIEEMRRCHPELSQQ